MGASKDSLFTFKDSITNQVKKAFFSDHELVVIDSLLIEEKFNSSLIDTLIYVINDKEIIGDNTIVFTKDVLKSRL